MKPKNSAPRPAPGAVATPPMFVQNTAGTNSNINPARKAPNQQKRA
jgi:hypothetical protein